MNGIVEWIKCQNHQALNIFCGDSHVSIEKRGSFNHIQQYSWTQTSPNAGDEMDYESFLITKEGILTNIGLMADDQITSEQQEAVKLFFND